MSAIEILCDFDGTVARVDTVDLLLERLADAEWRTLEEQWIHGEIDSRECMERQIALVRGGWRAIAEVLRDVELDSGFAPFAKWCRDAGVRLRVVSEGLDRVIRHLLDREGITVDEIWASQLVERGSGHLSLRFPPRPAPTFCGAALCKCALFPLAAPRPLRILVGDGRSDFCCARRADRVFAFSKLAIHCQQNEISFFPFTGFDGVGRFVAKALTVRPDVRPLAELEG